MCAMPSPVGVRPDEGEMEDDAPPLSAPPTLLTMGATSSSRTLSSYPSMISADTSSENMIHLLLPVDVVVVVVRSMVPMVMPLIRGQRPKSSVEMGRACWEDAVEMDRGDGTSPPPSIKATGVRVMFATPDTKHLVRDTPA